MKTMSCSKVGSTSSALSRSVWMEPTRQMLAPFERLRSNVVVSDSLTVAPGPAWALVSAPLKLLHLQAKTLSY